MINILTKIFLVLILILIAYNIYDLHLKIYEIKDWLYIFSQILLSH